MKAILLTSLLIAAATRSYSQPYFPFPTGNATWQVTRCFYFYPAGWYDNY